jgi:hypothetical protein
MAGSGIGPIVAAGYAGMFDTLNGPGIEPEPGNELRRGTTPLEAALRRVVEALPG